MSKNKIIGIICGAVVAVAAAVGITVAVINNNNGDTPAIVGKWKYYDKDSSYSLDFVYTFNKDGTGSYSMSGASMPFTYVTDGNKITITYDSGPFETEYEINGDILNVKDSGGSDTLYKKM